MLIHRILYGLAILCWIPFLCLFIIGIVKLSEGLSSLPLENIPTIYDAEVKNIYCDSMPYGQYTRYCCKAILIVNGYTYMCSNNNITECYMLSSSITRCDVFEYKLNAPFFTGF